MAERPQKRHREESERAKLVKKTKLPPEGHARREELARRRDRLERKLAKIMEEEQILGGTKPLKDMDIEREIYHALTEMRGEAQIEGAQPGFSYSWTIFRLPSSQSYSGQIEFKRTLGWEVVSGEMPEGRKRFQTGPDTKRYWADCILMRIPTKRLEIYNRVLRKLTMDKYGGVTAGLEELDSPLAQVHTDPNDPKFQQYVKGAYVEQEATRQYAKMMQEGRLPVEPGFEYGHRE